MNTTGSALSPGAGHQVWLPMLQLAAQEVFSLMLGSELKVPADPFPEQPLEVTAMVGLAGDLCGMVTTRCSAKSAARMASQMLGIDGEQAGQQMWDAVGEVCNMVAGNFKNKISGVREKCMLSVPTVITGGDYNLHPMADDAITTVLQFEGEPVSFTLEVHN